MTNIKQNMNRAQGQISCQKREFMHRARQSLLRQIEEKEHNDAMNKDQEGERRIYRSTLYYLIGSLLIFGSIIGCTHSIYRTKSERQLQGLKEAAERSRSLPAKIVGSIPVLLMAAAGPVDARLGGSKQHAAKGDGRLGPYLGLSDEFPGWQKRIPVTPPPQRRPRPSTTPPTDVTTEKDG